mgnify:CR=1 FL=1
MKIQVKKQAGLCAKDGCKSFADCDKERRGNFLYKDCLDTKLKISFHLSYKLHILQRNTMTTY